MSDLLDADELEIGECGLCHRTVELVATLTVTAGGRSVDLDACDECVRKVAEEMRQTMTSATITYDDDSTEEITRRPEAS
jgi:hypothetical protein